MLKGLMIIVLIVIILTMGFMIYIHQLALNNIKVIINTMQETDKYILEQKDIEQIKGVRINAGLFY